MFSRVIRPSRCFGNLLAIALCAPAAPAAAQFSFLTTAETRPQGSGQFLHEITNRSDKGHGDYSAFDQATSMEYGVTNDLSLTGQFRFQSLDTAGLLVPGYLPGDEQYAIDFAGVDFEGKYKFLNTAEHAVGLATFWEAEVTRLDKHSGKSKRYLAVESGLALQKYFLEGQFTWLANVSLQAVHATRGEIAEVDGDGNQMRADVMAGGRPLTLLFPDSGLCDEEGDSFYGALPACFEWPNFPEMEVELRAGTGFSYRFVNNWYLGLEGLYEEEYETEVGQERYSFFAGPGLHFEGRAWAVSVGYLRQLTGGGEKIDEADALHLIEKTKNEFRVKIGYNF